MSGEVCQRCEVDYPVWFAPSDVWNEAARGEDGSEEYPFLCPTCFVTLAELRGIVPTAWMVTPEVGGPVERAAQITFSPSPPARTR